MIVNQNKTQPICNYTCNHTQAVKTSPLEPLLRHTTTPYETHLSILVACFLVTLFFSLQLHLQQHAVRQLRLARGLASPIRSVQGLHRHQRVYELFVRYISSSSSSGTSSGRRRPLRRPSSIWRPAVVAADTVAQIVVGYLDVFFFNTKGNNKILRLGVFYLGRRLPTLYVRENHNSSLRLTASNVRYSNKGVYSRPTNSFLSIAYLPAFRAIYAPSLIVLRISVPRLLREQSGAAKCTQRLQVSPHPKSPSANGAIEINSEKLPPNT